MTKPSKRWDCPRCDYWTEGAQGETNVRVHLKKQHGETFHRKSKVVPVAGESEYQRGYQAGYRAGRKWAVDAVDPQAAHSGNPSTRE